MHLLRTLIFLGFAAQSIAALTFNKTNRCHSAFTNFTEGYGDWSEVSYAQAGFNITNNGLAITLLRPSKYVTLIDHNDNNLPYNNYTSPYAPTFQYKYKLQYGRVSYIMKTPGVSGVVTAGVIISDTTGDEIDFEMIGNNNSKIVQTNYFYGPVPVYNVNMRSNDANYSTAAVFHNYTVVWQPDVLKFYIDDKLIRTSYNNNKCDNNGNCEFPTHASDVKFGLWDASRYSGTAQWAMGPVNWNAVNAPVTGYVKSVEVVCDPNYNIMV